MTCPQCGARNTADAPWCTQCLVPLTRAEDASPPASPPAARAPAVRDDDRLTGPPAADTDGRDFRTVDGEVEWRCRDCDQWNPMLARTCTVCGSSMPGVDRSGDWSRQQVARTRRVLWVVAGVVCLLALIGVVVAVVAVRGAS